MVFTLSSVLPAQNPDLRLTTSQTAQGIILAPLTGVLYDQTSNPANEGGMASQDITDFPAFSCEAADDFTVPAGQVWTITEIKAPGAYTEGGGIAQVAHVSIYLNDPALDQPGTLVTALTDQPVGSTAQGTLTVNTGVNPIVLNPGHYWISVVPHMPFNPNKQWFWGKQESPVIMNAFYWRNPGGGWNVPGSQNWIFGYKVIGGVDNNLSFALIGTSNSQAVCPTADAGPDAAINSGESYMLADASATDYSSLFWSTSGSGSFDDPATLHATYTPGPSDIGNTIVLTLRALPVSPCTQAAFDQMKLTVNNTSAFQTCCPQFILRDAMHICPPEGACKRGTAPNPGGTADAGLAACKNTPHVYTVYPNDISFTYSWTVTGGTPSSLTGNPITINWGNGNQGYIKVVISNLASGGNCLDSITQEVCLIDGPTAGFTASEDTVCQGTLIQFTNASLGGSVFHWDFGDGNTSTQPNPAHTFLNPGTYTVLLTVTDMGAGQIVGTAQGENKVPCGCSDTISMQIVVLAGQGPVIETDCCYGTVCPDQTSTFCTPMVCATYNWSVTGGTIVAGAGTNCITVLWDPVYTVPTTVTLQSCPGSGCPGSTTLNVPVLYPNLPIAGPNQVCEGSSGTFTLPTLPGTFYNWTVTGGLYTFNLQDRNTPTVNITFNTPGPFWVKCQYNNPMAGCNGVDSIFVDVLPKFFITGDAKVCENTPANFNANGPANWSVVPAAGATILAGNGSPSVFISFAPGTYTVYASPTISGTFCNDTAFKVVEVVAKPILSVITGPVVVCPGDKNEYQVSSNVSGSPFIWQVTSNTGQVVAQMGDDGEIAIVDFTLPGPWVLTVYQQIELSPGNFCQSLPQTLTVNPFPTPSITGVLTVCVDDVQNYTAGVPSPPGDFQWTITPSSQGTILSGQGTNNVSIMWHGPAGSAVLSVSTCTGTDTKTVTINGPPPAVASYNILPLFCLNGGQTLVLSTPSGAYTYLWYKNGVPVPGGTGPSLTIVNNLVNFPTPGVYQYQVVVTQNGCSTTSNIINVIIEDCSAGGSGGPPGGTGCDVIAFFRPYVVCSTVTLIDKSVALPPATIASYSWTVSGPGTGTFSPNASVPSPTLTVSASGTYTITLTVTSSTGCTSTWTEVVNILLPVAAFNYTSPVCEGVPASFTAIPNNPNYNYFWTFGDGYTSYLPVTQHAYAAASPPPYNVTLVITDQFGCVATVNQPITVDPLPVCTIIPADTAFCPGDSVLLTACAGMSSYQWYKKNTPIPGATSSTYYVTSYGEYHVQVTNTYGCSGKSNKVFIYMYPKPKAKITGDAHVCGDPNNLVYFSLNTIYNANYSYNWLSNPAGATFSPVNGDFTWVSLTLPGTLPVSYEFIVEVTDNITLCKNSDTICVWFFQNPPATVPYTTACEGDSITLTPSPIDTNLFSYQWSNGATTPVITVSAPGAYILTVTDKANGCSTTVTGGMIFPKPDLSLFPIGCDSICKQDSIRMYIPLPLNALYPNNTYPLAYNSITWYANGNYGSPIGSGPNFWYYPNAVGNYQISVVVVNSFGCVDTAGVFCLKVKDCPPNQSSYDFGDAPDVPGNPLDYPTYLASGGAQHLIVPGIFMGSVIDAETDGQPNALSTGDDIAGGPDDEDGVTIPSVINQGATVNLTVAVSVPGFLDAWIDYNLDGDWADPGEHIFINTPVNLPVNPLTFTVPPTATIGQSYMRFRYRTTNAPISFSGPVNNGEVEDYAVYIDHCEAPTIDFGDAPDDPANMNDYPTLISSNGAGHLVVPGIFLGSKIDAEFDGQPGPGADCDDNNCVYTGVSDDEDGVAIPAGVMAGTSVAVTVVASVNGFLDAWMDFNTDGDWADAGEHIFITLFVTAGSNNLTFNVPGTATTGQSYARFRFRTTQAPITFSGLLFNGEVEDYAVYIEPNNQQGNLDFGDAPDNPDISGDYPTLLVSNGARHVINPNIYLGSKIDAEANGQPTFNSDGDDNNSSPDEDGVSLPPFMSPGSPVNITVTASVNGFLDAWIDFNMDGDWADAGEHVFNTQPVNAGANALTFTVPNTAFLGFSYSRFRFRTFNAPITFGGLVNEGEVEDYAVIIEEFPQGYLDFGDAPENPSAGFNYPTTLVNNGARHILNSAVYMGNLIDIETDGQPNIGATGDDIDLIYPSAGDDEDGVKFIGTMFVGKPATVQVSVSVPGFLNAWMDFDKNGDWTAAPEQIFTNVPVSAGVNTLSFNIPGYALTGKTYMRFRFNTAGGLTYSGQAMDGEIEDYQVKTCPHWNPIPTPVSHIIAMPADLGSLEPGDAIGVFFTDRDGSLKNAGLVEWDGMENKVMIAYGDDPTTPDIKEGFIVGEPIKWVLCKDIKVIPVDVLYDPQLPSHDGKFVNGGMSALVNFIGMGVTVTASPESVCAGGEVQLNASPVGPEIISYHWTSLPEGFTSDEQNPLVYPDVTTIYIVETFDGVFTSFDSVSVQVNPVQTLNIKNGWGGVSTYVAPLDKDVTHIFAPMGDLLTILYNYFGVYWPAQGVNSIGNWNEYQGYIIKSAGVASIPVCGTEIEDKTISLARGWNIIPALCSGEINVAELFASIPNPVVKDIAGPGVYWPAYGINTLGTLKPGASYYANVPDPTPLYQLWNCIGEKSQLEQSAVQSPWNEVVQTPESHVIAFTESATAILEEGDFIGGFTPEGLCAGWVQYSGNATALAVNGDDPYTQVIDGFSTGEPLSYRLFRPSTGEMFDLEVVYGSKGHESLFAPHGLSVVEHLKLSASGSGEDLLNKINIFPNPSQGIFNITGPAGNFRISVMNSMGSEVYNSEMTELPVRIDFGAKPKGVYLIRIDSAKSVSYRKLVVE